MKINLKIISLLVIICLLSISVASAAEDAQIDDLQASDADDVVSVDDAEPVLADDTTTPGKYADLNNLVKQASAGDTISLESDYETGTVIAIDKEMTIDGQGHTINGKQSDRIFVVRDANVILQNIIFKDGYKADTDSGGAVLGMDSSKNGVKLTIINCTFINNKATYGGAIYTKVGGNKIINCTFDGNKATQTGGAINFNANGNTIINNTFKNNVATANNGGAIAITGKNTAGTNIIKGNTFENNKATKADAGAIYLEQGKSDEISGNIFTKNSATRGGAVSLYQTGHFTLKNNTFTSNTATGLGGAVRANVPTDTSKTIISENTFKSNSAPNTGALHIDEGNVEISRNVFDNNKATSGYGGSIQYSGKTLTISNNNITNSNAKTLGGAMIVKKGTSMTIKSNHITNANAANGGAIYVESGSATIDSNNISKCTATGKGGAIRADTKVTITKNTFTDNKATDKGSDVYIYKGANSKVTDNNFATSTENSLKNDDGKIVANNNKGLKETVTISTLNKNYAVTTTTKYLTVVLKDSTGAGIAGKKITITLNGKNYNGVTDDNGQYKTKIALTKVNTYSCTVKFAGDEKYYAATPYKFNIAVKRAATKISSPAKTFKKSATKKIVITLKSGKTFLKKQKVTLKINGKTYTGRTTNNGKATIKIKIAKKGTFKGTLSFAKTAKYSACTGKVTIKVK